MFEAIKGFFSKIFQAIASFFENLVQVIKNAFLRLWEKLKTLFAPLTAWLRRIGFAVFKAYCRVFQAIVAVGGRFVRYRTPKTLEGPGAVCDLPRIIKNSGVDNVLVVCGPHIAKSGLADGLLEKLDEEKVAYTIFSDLQSNPTDDNVEAGLAVLRRYGSDGIIAFGGGSSIDCAKAIAARNARPDRSVKKLQGTQKVRRKILPLWAIPTTAGTGSESTVAAVITDEKTKYTASVTDRVLMPRMAVLDPALTVSLPPEITATTAMDALCHAVEAYTNGTYNARYEKKLAKQAVKLIYDNVYAAYCDGTNLEVRQNLQTAAFCAGRAFTRGCAGYAHACGHPISALYGLPHGQVMACLLPRVMRAYGEAVHKRLAELADVCGIIGETDAEKAEAFLAWIEDTNEKTGIPDRIPEIQSEDIPRMVKWAQKEACPLYPVPVIWSKEALTSFYECIMAE